MFNLAENRKYPRMAIDCAMTYKYVDDVDVRYAVAKNISGSGVLFIAGEEPQLGTLVELKVNPGSLSIPPLNAIVEVVRVNRDSNRRWQPAESTTDHYEVAARIKTIK
jgi:hypothetical protein